MLVDDQPANLKLLEDMLKQQHYVVRSFPRGRLALAAAAERPPELILLDINMPEMDGLEVCRRLKSDPKLAGIPVIFLSALNETEDKVKAFRCGGVDYITKPFQFEEVQSRVASHLKLHELLQALRRQNEELEDLVQARTRELQEAHARLKVLDQSKSEFLCLISHELRTPLNGLLGVGELLLDGLDSGLREMYGQSRRRILTILDHAVLLTQIEVEGEKSVSRPVSLAEIVERAATQAAGFARPRRVTLAAESGEAVFVSGREDLLLIALQALLETAVKFSVEDETVSLTTRTLADEGQVEIRSRGRSLPAAAIPRFFELFSITEAVTPGGDLGLDAPVAHRILKLCGGSVTVENLDSAGIQITVSLKRAPGL